MLKLNSDSMNALQHREDLGMAAFKKTGPNDAICVVWTTGEFFFSIILLFLQYAKIMFSVYDRFSTLRA